MWQMLAGAGASMLGNILGARSARKAGQAAANIRAGQAGENAALARELPYRLNPYLQQSAEQWSQNVRDQTGESAAHLEDVAGQAGGYLNPYLTQGQAANTSLQDWATQQLTGPQAQFAFSEQDPSYQWRLAEGQKALERSAASRGTLRTGGTLKALTRYAQDAASQEYAAEHARWLAEQEMARRGQELGATTLSGLAGRGLTAGTQMGDWRTRAAEVGGDWRNKGAQYQSDLMYGNTRDAVNRILAGEQAGMNYMTDRADALAGGNIAAGQAQANMWGGLGNAAGQGLSLWGMMQPQGTPGGGGPTANLATQPYMQNYYPYVPWGL
jgi:hypothetical protein